MIYIQIQYSMRKYIIHFFICLVLSLASWYVFLASATNAFNVYKWTSFAWLVYGIFALSTTIIVFVMDWINKRI